MRKSSRLEFRKQQMLDEEQSREENDLQCFLQLLQHDAQRASQTEFSLTNLQLGGLPTHTVALEQEDFQVPEDWLKDTMYTSHRYEELSADSHMVTL
jgi:hypothetical protein